MRVDRFAVKRKHRLLTRRLNRLSAAIAIEALRLCLKNLQETEFLDFLPYRRYEAARSATLYCVGNAAFAVMD